MDGIISWTDLVKDKQFNGCRIFESKVGETSSYLQPLNCGVTNLRLVNPARGLNCQHQACIELMELFSHVERIRKWECPLCLKPIPYYQLYIDLKVKQILSKLKKKGDKATVRVEIFGDGTWRPESGLEERKTEVVAAVDTTSTIVTLFPVEVFSGNNGDVKLSDLIDPKKEPAYIVNFPWNSNEAQAFDFRRHVWVNLPQLTNSLRKYSYFTMVHTSPMELVICGGVDYEYYQIALVHVFSPEVGLVRKKPMNMPRSHFPAVMVEGEIYVFGGLCNGETIAVCEKYSINEDRWSDIAPMPTGRCCHVAAPRSNQAILVMAGCEFSGQSATILKYDIATDEWTLLGLTIPMTVESPHTLLFKHQNILILFGGIAKNDAGKLKPSKAVQLFKMNTFQWRTSHTQLNFPIGECSFPTVHDLADNKAHIVTGGDEPVHIIYDMRQEFLQRPVPEIASSDAISHFTKGLKNLEQPNNPSPSEDDKTVYTRISYSEYK